MAFSFPWLLSMARKKPGRYDAGVNGLHGHSARAPVYDGGRPGKLSRRVTTSQGNEEKAEIAARCSRLNPRLRGDRLCAAEGTGRAIFRRVTTGGTVTGRR